MYVSRFFILLTRTLSVLALLALLVSPVMLIAEEPAQGAHLVSPEQLQQQMEAATARRQQNIETLTQALSTPAAEQAMQTARVDPVQVRTAIPSLSDTELADLAARANHAQSDFAGGGIGMILLIWLLVVIVLTIIVVTTIHPG